MNKVIIYLLIFLTLIIITALIIKINNGTSDVLNVSFKTESSSQDTEIVTNPIQPKFVNLGPAPEITGVTKWLNGEPLTIARLKGKVILLDFWTYSCINCIRTLPYVNAWYDKYKDHGLMVVGIHTPEFAFEKVTSNVETAIKRYAITYPVAQDNNYKTWLAYNNQFWPAHYLINQDGNIVYTHFGEGQYQQTEQAIKSLLGLEDAPAKIPNLAVPNLSQTPEIYLGLARLNNFGGTETVSNEEQIYTFGDKLAKNHFALEGKWKLEPEAAIHTQGFGRIRLNFTATKVFMVAQSQDPTTVKIYQNNKPLKGVTIHKSDLYQLFDASTSVNRTIDIEFPIGGVQVFTFTFR